MKLFADGSMLRVYVILYEVGFTALLLVDDHTVTEESKYKLQNIVYKLNQTVRKYNLIISF